MASDFDKRDLQLIKFYRENPVIAAEDLLNIELAVPQRNILRDMWFKSFVLVSAGRGCGKTFLDAVLACLWALLFPGQKVGLLAPSFRQCVVANTLIETENGLEYVGSLKKKPKQLLSSEGIRDCSAFFKNIAAPTVRIISKRGLELEGAPDHKVLIIDSFGKLIYKTLSSLSENDYICFLTGSLSFSKKEINLSSYVEKFVKKGNARNCNIPEYLDDSLAYFLGLLTGDGCLTKTNYIQFTNTDEHVLSIYRELASNYFDRFCEISKVDGNKVDIIKGNKRFYSFLCETGLGDKYAHEKTIPDIIFKAKRSNVISYIRGLFDTDGGVYFYEDSSHKYKVSISLAAKKLVKELQIILLGLGIYSSISVNKGHRKHPLFQLEISDKKSIFLFSEIIGFVSEKKKEKLFSALKYISKMDVNRSHTDIVPNVGALTGKICSLIRKLGKNKFEYLQLWKRFDDQSNPRKGKSFTVNYLNKLIDYCDNNGISCSELVGVKCLLKSNIVFDQIKEKITGFDVTYDFTVEKTHNYFSNGFISHNSKMVFAEVDKIWNMAPLLREATVNKPIRASDRCYLNFRQAGNSPPSIIDAVPLGDGNKIRGARYYVIIADEFAQIPVDIFNTVILPMAATVANPMENVKRVKQQASLVEKGLAKKEDFLTSDNKIIMTSSAFYQFNHMYETLLTYKERIERGDNKYAVHNISYRDMPKGFLSEDNIADAMARLSAIQFRMEYGAIWEADSAGVFKASLVEKCRRDADHTVSIKGRPGAQYLLGVDPARASDAFAICLLELGTPNKVVAAWEYYQNQFPQMAKTVMELCDLFDIVAIHMDAGAGGGGLAMKDLLAEEERFGHKRILDAEDEDTEDLIGRRILYMFNPAPKSTAEAVYATLNLMEKNCLTLPQRPQPKGAGEAAFKSLEEEEKVYETVERMLQQIMLIEVSESRSGVAHFDVPSGGGHAAQKKDLYTAFVLASKKAYDMMIVEEDPNSILEVGLVEKRSDYKPIPKSALTESMGVMPAPVTSWALRKTFKPG